MKTNIRKLPESGGASLRPIGNTTEVRLRRVLGEATEHRLHMFATRAMYILEQKHFNRSLI